jgi:hypothetical protein
LAGWDSVEELHLLKVMAANSCSAEVQLGEMQSEEQVHLEGPVAKHCNFVDQAL